MHDRTAIFAGTLTPLCHAVPPALVAAGYRVGDAPPANVLLNLDMQAQPETLMAQCAAFAAQAPEGAAVISVLLGGGTWQAAQRLACMSAFTRHHARAWAPRRIRINSIAVGVAGPAAWNAALPESGAVAAEPATPDDIARVVMAVLGFPSMTGQLIRLGG